MQGALPNILKQTPESFFQETLQVIEGNAKVLYIFNIIDGIDYLDAICIPTPSKNGCGDDEAMHVVAKL